MSDAPSDAAEPGFVNSSSLLDSSTHVAWKDFDLAVTEFCYSQSLQVFESDTLISTLVGEGENETEIIFAPIYLNVLFYRFRMVWKSWSLVLSEQTDRKRVGEALLRNEILKYGGII